MINLDRSLTHHIGQFPRMILDYQAMLGMHVCQECLCPNAHVLTIEHVLMHIIIIPEHVNTIVMLYILDLRPRYVIAKIRNQPKTSQTTQKSMQTSQTTQNQSKPAKNQPNYPKIKANQTKTRQTTHKSKQTSQKPAKPTKIDVPEACSKILSTNFY